MISCLRPLVLFVATITVTVANAQTGAEFKPIAIATQTNDSLRIRGFDGDVKVIPGKAGQLLVRVKQEIPSAAEGIIRQTLDEWNFSAQRVEGGIELMVQSPSSKDVWRQILSGKAIPKFHLEVTAPPMPLDLSWRNGQLTLEGWAANVHVSWQNGSVLANGGSGDCKIFGQNVDIRVKNRNGRVVAESYSGKVILDQIKGPAEVENFSGETTVTELEGNLDFQTFKAPLSVSGGKGRIQFETIRGPIKVNNYSGSLKGKTDEASVVGKIIAAQEIRITSQSGAVSLDLPNSGASVSATSVEGAISGPPHLRAEQGTGQKVMRGRLKGGVEGSIIVRSQTGPIKIR